MKPFPAGVASSAPPVPNSYGERNHHIAIFGIWMKSLSPSVAGNTGSSAPLFRMDMSLMKSSRPGAIKMAAKRLLIRLLKSRASGLTTTGWVATLHFRLLSPSKSLRSAAQKEISLAIHIHRLKALAEWKAAASMAPCLIGDGCTRRVACQSLLAYLQEFLRPYIVHALGNPFWPALTLCLDIADSRAARHRPRSGLLPHS